MGKGTSYTVALDKNVLESNTKTLAGIISELEAEYNKVKSIQLPASAGPVAYNVRETRNGYMAVIKNMQDVIRNSITHLNSIGAHIEIADKTLAAGIKTGRSINGA